LRYALLMYADPDHTKGMSESELDVIAGKHEALRNELTESGELLNGAGLVFPEETTVVRFGAEGPQQGPLIGDADEHLTAYYVVECASPERAQALAEHVLDHHVTSVEVRRIHDSIGT
jgi:hypothetical protein